MATAALVLCVGGCGLIPPDILRVVTDPKVHRSQGVCDAWRAGEAVSGRLYIERQGDVAETWLIGDSGVRLAVIWPHGFTVRSGDSALLDESGHALYREGQVVELGQVSRKDAAGTALDPYVATGIFDGGCWLRTN